MAKGFHYACALLVTGSAMLVGSCGGGDTGGSGGGAGGNGTGGSGGRPDNTGAACKTASDCYPGVKTSDIQGTVECLTEIMGGYCTHECMADADCCAAKGECKSMIKEVCSPFESTGKTLCFLSCEPSDIFGTTDDATFCQAQAGTSFICRSSGGGSDNRKICVPGTCGVGAGCATTVDCASGLDCITTLPGGYCGHEGCMANADCPTGSLCVKAADGKNACLTSCSGASDCSFCRSSTHPATCTSTNVKFVEAGTTGTVCVP